MKKIPAVVIMLGLIACGASSEVTRKLTVNPDKTRLILFSDESGKEVARRQLDKDGVLLKEAGKVPEGPVKQYFKDGKVQAEWNFKNGKEEGLFREYWDDGKLCWEGKYSGGKPEGIKRFYYKTGKLGYEDEYRAGIQTGRKSFYESGKVNTEGVFKDGKEIERKWLRENGKLQGECAILNGKETGKKFTGWKSFLTANPERLG